LTGQAWHAYLEPKGDLQAVDAGPDVPIEVDQTSLGLEQLLESTEIRPGQSGSSVKSTVTAPVVLRGEVIGALSLQDLDHERAWNQNDITLLQAVANEVAIAVENARLIEQTERRAAREAQLNLIGEKIRQAADIETILRVAAEELNQSLDATHTNARLGKPTTLAGRRNNK
jgi:GAF domain-containing protein